MGEGIPKHLHLTNSDSFHCWTGGFEEETGAAEEEILDVLLDVGLDVAGDAVSSFPTGTIFPVEEVFVHRKHRKGPAHRAAFSSFLTQVEFRLSF